MKIKGKTTHDLLTIWLPSKVKRRCPAIILAAKRTESVIGRIIFLTNSMSTIKGIRTAGVPVGTRCAKKSVRLLISLNRIKASHSGRAIERVIARCLVAVKVNDKRLIVLLIIIMMKSLVNKIMLIFLFFRSVSNSLFIVFMTFLIPNLKGLERIQYEGTIRMMNKIILSQFVEINNKATGSKIENRLLIIFKYDSWKGYLLSLLSFC